MQYDVTALGEILIDFIPNGYDADGDTVFIRKAGGAPLNLLATVSKFGGNTAFIGKVGADIFGKFLKDTVLKNGIDAAGLKIDAEHNTTMAFVELSTNGERDFSFCRRFGADVFLRENDIDTERIKNTKIFHYGSLSSVAEPSASATKYAVRLAQKSGAIVSYDPNYRPPLWKSQADAVRVMRNDLPFVDILKVSLEEAQMLTGYEQKEDCLKALSDFGVSVVLLTDGAVGTSYCINGQNGFLPAEKVQSVDTTGAGDIFFGTFLSAFLQSKIPLKELDFDRVASFVKTANHVAALSTLKHGAIASIPNTMQ